MANVTRGFDWFEKNLVAVVTTTFQLCLKIFQNLVATVTRYFEEIQKMLVAVVTMII